jgi:hypothetical protein
MARKREPASESLLDLLKRLAHRLVDPLRADDELENFTLSIPETQTTTVDGDIGWAKRPPATLQCPNCESEVHQHDWRDDIDCTRCTTTYSYDEFAELELLYLTCPVCNNGMEHGQRHPDAIDLPEWASCHHCRYHWEFAHDFE